MRFGATDAAGAYGGAGLTVEGIAAARAAESQITTTLDRCLASRAAGAGDWVQVVAAGDSADEGTRVATLLRATMAGGAVRVLLVGSPEFNAAVIKCCGGLAEVRSVRSRSSMVAALVGGLGVGGHRGKLPRAHIGLRLAATPRPLAGCLVLQSVLEVRLMRLCKSGVVYVCEAEAEADAVAALHDVGLVAGVDRQCGLSFVFDSDAG